MIEQVALLTLCSNASAGWTASTSTTCSYVLRLSAHILVAGSRPDLARQRCACSMHEADSVPMHVEVEPV